MADHATPRQVRAAMADQLRQILGWQVTDYMNANPTPPCAEIRRGPVDYHQAMGDGISYWTMLVRAYVANATDRGSATLLDGYLSVDGPSSVKAAIEADPTLGGLVSDLTVVNASGETAYTLEGMPALLGSEWTVVVYV